MAVVVLSTVIEVRPDSSSSRSSVILSRISRSGRCMSRTIGTECDFEKGTKYGYWILRGKNKESVIGHRAIVIRVTLDERDQLHRSADAAGLALNKFMRVRAGLPAVMPPAVSRRILDPRNNADDAYQIFMRMSESEWSDCIQSILRGGRFEVEEDKGFRRAVKDRSRPT